MPKLPRDASHDRVVRFLLARGWTHAGGTRHTILRRGLVFVAIPQHAKIKTGTLASILRRCKIPPGEWHEL